MMTGHFDRIKNLSILLIIVLAAVCCAAFDVSAGPFSPAGSITGTNVMPVSHSMISLVHTGIRDDNGGVSSRGHSLERAAAASELPGRVMRKLLTAAGAYIPFGSLNLFRSYILLICTSVCIFLFCTVFIRFIHLKDGSK